MTATEIFPELEEQIAELKRAGWKQHPGTISVWIAPNGAWFRGPHGAWKTMKVLNES